jgi:hypothetical protein
MIQLFTFTFASFFALSLIAYYVGQFPTVSKLFITPTFTPRDFQYYSISTNFSGFISSRSLISPPSTGLFSFPNPVVQSKAKESPSKTNHINYYALPAAINATWITVPTQPDPEYGSPAPRGDNILKSLGGWSQAVFNGIPFPHNTLPTTDPYAGLLWVFGGHGYSDVTFNESWTLNISASPAQWQFLNYSSDSDVVVGEWGVPGGLIPNGIYPGDSGLTSIFVGGFGHNGYYNGLYSYNFANKRYKAIVPTDPAGTVPSTGKISPRSWTQMRPLRPSFGTVSSTSPYLSSNSFSSGSWATTNFSSSFFLFGGIGPEYGQTTGINCHSLPTGYVITMEPWDSASLATGSILSKANFTFTLSGNYVCQNNVSFCSDDQPLYSYGSSSDISEFNYIYQNSSFNVAQITRPALARLYLESMLSNISSFNTSIQSVLATANSMKDDPSACRYLCYDYEPVNTTDPLTDSILVTNAVTSPSLHPGRLEGARQANYKSKFCTCKFTSFSTVYIIITYSQIFYRLTFSLKLNCP